MIYLDNAATTRVRGEVLDIMLPYLKEGFGNPSGTYAIARSAHAALDTARGQVAEAIGAAHAREIFFTGCGTESDNWALRGVMEHAGYKGHILTTKTEHHAVLHCCEALQKLGVEVTYLDVDRFGAVSADDVRAAMREDTRIVSIIHANNEIGTVNPIRDISAAVHERGAVLHVDAVQSAGHIPIDVKAMGIDLLSISGHKFHSPKGVGALYIKGGTPISPLIYGGAQERGRRSGTENLASIAGMGLAIKLSVEELAEESARQTAMRDYMIARLITDNHDARLNGHPTERLPGNINVSFPDIRAEALLLDLDLEGIAASSGSACSAGAIGASHVLIAAGVDERYISGAVRFSLSRYTTLEDIETACDAVKRILPQLKK